MIREECASNAAAYALGALEPEEAEAYERHVSGCPACREELAAIRQVVDALPLAAPQYRLPSGLRRRTVRAIRATSRRARPARVAIPAAAVTAALAAAIIITQRPAGTSLPPAAPTAQVRIGAGHAQLSVQHLPSPAPGRIYEVWLKRPNAPPAPTAALFSVNAAGAADIAVPGDLRGVRQILVTEEPAGGSRVPTGPPVIVAPTS